MKKKTGFGRLMEIAGEKRGLLAFSCVLSVISAALMFVPFVAIYFIVSELFANAADPAMSNMTLIQSWGVWALLSLLAALAFLYASTMMSHVSAFRILYNLRIRLARHLATLPMGYHTRQASGTIKKTLEFSVEKIEGFVAHQLPDMAGAVALPALMIAAMFALDWRLALACAIPIVIAYIMQTVAFYGPKIGNSTKDYHDALEEMNAAGVEYVRGMPAVKVFGITVKKFLSFHSSIKNFRNFALRISKQCERPYLLFMTLITSLLSFILPVGVFLLSGQPENQAFALTLMLFLVIAPGLSVPVMKLMYLGGNMRQISEGVVRMDKIFAQKPMPEPENPKEPDVFDVEFDSVFFSYDSIESATRSLAVGNVSFCAREKEITALVGPSGSGKTTIANLIPRFWDVDGGAVRIGGVDIREMGTERLMRAVSFVFQDVHLFYDTIEENIRMGRADATREEVIRAAQAACCHEFITRLPKGYQTKIGEGGTYLSGGEAQRVSIARAILKNAPVLVLDEATAFADPENEIRIQQALSGLIQGKTVIVIAHRLSTIREAGQILVMDQGRLAETGTHEELLKTGGLYRRMWMAHVDAGTWTLAGEQVERTEYA